jgi:cell division septal protein FtsQ
MAGRSRTRRSTTSTASTGKARRRKPATSGRRSSARLGTTFETALEQPKRVKAGAGLLWRLGVRPHQALGLTCLVLLVALTTVLFRSPSFYVWDATVTGAQWQDAGQVYQMSGLEGLSIFYVDPAHVADTLVRLPGVKQVSVRCRLPNRVSIHITERTPVAIWQSEGVQYWVDAEGMLFSRYTDLPNPLVIVEQDAVARRPGEVVDARVVETVRELHTLLPEVSAFGYSRNDGLLFATAQGRQVRARVGCDAVKVVSALAAVEQKLANSRASAGLVDLRYETRAFWR